MGKAETTLAALERKARQRGILKDHKPDAPLPDRCYIDEQGLMWYVPTDEELAEIEKIHAEVTGRYRTGSDQDTTQTGETD